MHRALAFALSVPLAVLVSGCGLSSVAIHSEALSFGGVIEDTTNKLLVMNVLRARDKAPLHFADIPVVRESIQQTASFSLFQFLGGRLPPQTTDTLTAGAGIQMTPSFEITHLHSKEFITGITSPIDPRAVKYWLDRGLDPRLVLLLFFSAVEITETASANGPVTRIRIENAPRQAADLIKERKGVFSGDETGRCDSQSDFERYLKLFVTLRSFFATSYRERRLLAKGIKPGDPSDFKNLQALAALDHSKVQLVLDQKAGTYSFYALSSEQKVAFCFHDDARVGGAASAGFEPIDAGPAATSRRSCSQPIVDIGSEDVAPSRTSISPEVLKDRPAGSGVSPYCGLFNRLVGVGLQQPPAGGYPRIELRLYIRSVGEIFQFLGDLLYYQDEVRKYLDANPQLDIKLNSPVTFGYCRDRPETGCDNVFLRLDGDPCNARFSLNYRGRDYHVGNFNPPETPTVQGGVCRPDRTARKDHTLEVLAVLHQLVGLNKSASDIRSTPTVQVLP